MAGPIWNPTAGGRGQERAAARAARRRLACRAGLDRTRRQRARERIAAANREGRATALVAMSDGGRDISPGDATRANERLRTLKPVPHVPDRLAVLPAVQRFLATNRNAEVVWIADGLEMGHAREFADGLAAAAGDTRVHVVTQESSPMAIVSADNSAGALEVRLVRPDLRTPQTGTVRALDMKGLLVGEARFDFGREREAVARFELPIELRNEISRVEIADVHSAGAVSLLDERWKRRRVGFASGSTIDTAQPLLSPTYYLRRALAPFADVREVGPGRGDPILKLLDDNLSVLVLADIGVVSGPAHDAVTRFVQDGGVLLRFAGTRLASSSDDLVPVRLRRGGARSRRLAVVGDAEAARAIPARKSARGSCRSERSDRDAAGSRRTGCVAAGQDMGAARRRDAARHRRASRQGADRSRACDGGYDVVQSAALGAVRRPSATGRRHGGGARQGRCGAGRGIRRADARADDFADAHARWFRRPRSAAAHRASDSRDIRRAADGGVSARLLWPARWSDGHQHIVPVGPARAGEVRPIEVCDGNAATCGAAGPAAGGGRRRFPPAAGGCASVALARGRVRPVEAAAAGVVGPQRRACCSPRRWASRRSRRIARKRRSIRWRPRSARGSPM